MLPGAMMAVIAAVHPSLLAATPSLIALATSPSPITQWGPATLTALVGAFVAWTAYSQNKHGRADTAQEQKAANQIKADAQQFEQQQSLIASHVAEIERVNAARDAEQERHDHEVRRLRDALERQREDCRHHTQSQAQTIELLRGMIANEVNKASVEAALAMGVDPDQARAHLVQADHLEQARQDGYDHRTQIARREDN